MEKYLPPADFDMWKDRALDMGFLYCASGPLVRSSYKAGEAFIENVLRKRKRGEAVGTTNTTLSTLHGSRTILGAANQTNSTVS